MSNPIDISSILANGQSRQGPSAASVGGGQMPVPGQSTSGNKRRKRGRPPGKMPKSTSGGYSLQKLRSKHHHIINLHSTGLYTNEQIADMLNCTAQTVSNVLNTSLAQIKLNRIQGTVEADVTELQKGLVELGAVALEVAEDTMTNSPDERLRTSTAMKVLEMSGAAAPKKSEVYIEEHNQVDILLQDIKERAKEQKKVRQAFEDAQIISETEDKDESA